MSCSIFLCLLFHNLCSVAKKTTKLDNEGFWHVLLLYRIKKKFNVYKKKTIVLLDSKYNSALAQLTLQNSPTTYDETTHQAYFNDLHKTIQFYCCF